MKKIHIVGGQNHGKTTLMVQIVKILTERGYRVGSVKYTPHTYELDQRGKDSFRHREAGANPAAIVSGSSAAVYLSPALSERPWNFLEQLYIGCDLVLVEGNTSSHDLKLEVWRKELNMPPLAESYSGVTAVITDDPVPGNLTVWPRKDPECVTDRLLLMAGLA